MKAKIIKFFYDIKDYVYIYGNLMLLILVFLLAAAIMYIGIFPNPIKKKANEKEIYRNEKLLIVGTNEAAQDFTHDKFHRPIITKVWLVQRLKDTTQFAELDSNYDSNDFHVTNELWYSKGIGDTLYFDYIRKTRFFTINNKQ